MTVLMTMQMSGDGAQLEKYAQAEPDKVRGIVEKAKSHGLIAHRFWASADAILVVDEWPDEESFRAFFDSAPEVGEMMAAVGVTSEPRPMFWRRLDAGDEYPA